MATLTGLWVIHDKPNLSVNNSEGYIWQNYLFAASNGQDIRTMQITETDQTIAYCTTEEWFDVYKDNNWVDDAYRILDFGEVGAIVSDEFYAWFTANASNGPIGTSKEYLIREDSLKSIADGFRSSRGTSEEYTVEQMAVMAAEPLEVSGGIDITGAAVGQTVKISEVDENGVPTAWEPADFPSGGDEPREWEEFIRFTTDNAETIVFDFSSNGMETLESKKVKEFYLYSPHCNSGDCSGAITINESITIENLLNFCRPTGTLKLSLAVSPEALKFRYFGRDTDLHFNTPAAAFVTMMGQSIGNNVKAFAFNITEMRDGIAFPSSSVDYIKTVTVTLLSPCLSGVEFIVYVR